MSMYAFLIAIIGGVFKFYLIWQLPNQITLVKTVNPTIIEQSETALLEKESDSQQWEIGSLSYV